VKFGKPEVNLRQKPSTGWRSGQPKKRPIPRDLCRNHAWVGFIQAFEQRAQLRRSHAENAQSEGRSVRNGRR
jgi:hypothetical protein